MNNNHESKIKIYDDVYLILSNARIGRITNRIVRAEFFGRESRKLGEKVSRETFSLNPLIHLKDFAPHHGFFFSMGNFSKVIDRPAGKLSTSPFGELAPRFDDLFKYLCPLARFLFFRDRTEKLS